MNLTYDDVMELLEDLKTNDKEFNIVRNKNYLVLKFPLDEKLDEFNLDVKETEDCKRVKISVN